MLNNTNLAFKKLNMRATLNIGVPGQKIDIDILYSYNYEHMIIIKILVLACLIGPITCTVMSPKAKIIGTWSPGHP